MADQSQGRNPGHAIFGFTDPEPRSAAPTEAPPSQQPPPQLGAPQYVYVQGPPPGLTPSSGPGKWLVVMVFVLLALALVNLYLIFNARQHFNDTASKQSDELNLLTRRLDSSDERYAQLKGQFQVTTEKLGLTQKELSRARTLAAGIQQEQQKAVQQLNDAIAKKASAEEVNKVQADATAKIAGVSSDLAGTKADLEATKNALTGAKGELSGAIARTHDELVELAHRTDRDYFEFNVSGKKGEQKVGTVTIQLVKTDVKRNTYAVNLVFDDKSHPHKDRTTNEPLFFYAQGASSSLELVVNKLGKNSMSGYLSTPKGFFAGTPNVLGSRPST